MTENAGTTCGTLHVLLSLLAVGAAAAGAPGQELPRPFPDGGGEPLLPRQVWLGGGPSRPNSNSKTARIRLFRMTTGFVTNPVGLDTDDDFNPAILGDPAVPAPVADDGRLGVVLGGDNPFFDFKAPGDPGGVGYYKVHTQLQVLDSTSTYLSVGFQAFTPAGLESDGLANGPTVVKPTVACSHEWQDGTAIHGFVGKPVTARAGWTDGLERGLHYGLALQSPIVAQPGGAGLHMFVEAVGNSRNQGTTGQPPLVNWEVIPGLHWQVRDNWWLSSGVIVPLNTPKYDPGLLHITCSLRF